MFLGLTVLTWYHITTFVMILASWLLILAESSHLVKKHPVLSMIVAGLMLMFLVLTIALG